MKTVISHPFGNQNVRQVLCALSSADMLERFHTTVYWDARWAINRLLPAAIKEELNRRSYPQITKSQISAHPKKEAIRLVAGKASRKLPLRVPTAQEVGTSLDLTTAKYVARKSPAAIYCYSGFALATFKAGRSSGSKCFCELPNGYWRYNKQLATEEAHLVPEYADTLRPWLRDSAFLDARDEELSLADRILVPSAHVHRTLNHFPGTLSNVAIIPYGSGPTVINRKRRTSKSGPLRVIFVGNLSQIKGISYAVEASKMVAGLIEFTLIGNRVGSSKPLENVLQRNRWIPSLPNTKILEEMAQSDVLVLPSLSEGFGLVILEALACGLPVITTTESGGPEIVRDQKDGFIVPIRSAEAIAQKLELLAKDRDLLEHMSDSALQRAGERSWDLYREVLINTLRAS